jgi:prophage antirepressor-like protein
MSNHLTPTNGQTPKIFAFDSHALRVVTIAGEPWFVAADVLDAIELDRKALERLDDDEKGVSSIHTLGGEQAMNIVSEPGLYSLVLGSRKPEAKRFKRWVTHEVLPSIRKTGRYAAPAQRAVMRTGRAVIDRAVELRVLTLYLEDMNLADIGRTLGVARTTVHRLVSGQQIFGPHAGPDQTTPELRAAVVAKRMQAEHNRFVERVQTKYCISASNLGLALEYDRAGRQLLQAIGAPLPENLLLPH